MTTMRSVEPLTGADKVLARIFPFLNGTRPQPGERGCDRLGRIYVWQPETNWHPTGRLRDGWGRQQRVLDSQAEAEAG